MAVHDIIDLKDMIKSLQSQRNDLLEEQMSLEKEIEVQSARLVTSKQENNLLLVTDAIRAIDVEGDDASNSKENKKFAEMDRKIEVDIMLSDMKAALPNLEQEALRWESLIHEVEKKCNKATEEASQLPDHLFYPTSYWEDQVIQLTEEKVSLKGMLSAKLLKKTTKNKKRLDLQIHALRNDILALRDEQLDIQHATHIKSHTPYLVETAKVELLSNEHAQLLQCFNRLTDYYRDEYSKDIGHMSACPTAWYFEAFLSAADTLGERVSWSQILDDILPMWSPNPFSFVVLSSSDTGPSAIGSLPFKAYKRLTMQDDGQDLDVNPADSLGLTFTQFCLFCDYLLELLASSGEGM